MYENRILKIRESFKQKETALKNQCLYYATINDLETIEKLLVSKRQISCRIRALNHFMDWKKDRI